MRAALIALTVLLLPAALIAEPNIGIYFAANNSNPAGPNYSPQAAFEEFSGSVILNDAECYVSAAEFMVQIPAGIDLVGFWVPDGSLTLGTVETGFSITYFPPLVGFGQPVFLCRLDFLARKWCMCATPPGTLLNNPMVVVADPGAVPNPGIFYTCYPDQELHCAIGTTSMICPEHPVAVQSKSWGAIKSLYGN